jgi:hypothetical protein
VVIQIHSSSTKILSTGEKVDIRKLTITDRTEKEIELTLWREITELEVKLYDFVILKNGKVKLFKDNKTISTINNSYIRFVSNDNDLFGYVDKYKSDEYIKDKGLILNHIKEKEKENEKDKDKKKEDNLKLYRTIESEIIPISLLLEKVKECIDKDKVFYIKAFISDSFDQSNKNFYYGCPLLTCRSKLINDYCSKCNIRHENNKRLFYYLGFYLYDHSNLIIADAFGDVAEEILKIPVNEYKKIIERNDQNEISKLNSNYQHKEFLFGVKHNNNYVNKDNRFIIKKIFLVDN